MKWFFILSFAKIRKLIKNLLGDGYMYTRMDGYYDTVRIHLFMNKVKQAKGRSDRRLEKIAQPGDP
jgi:hypothetical protein